MIATQNNRLLAGFGKADVTPSGPVHLGSCGNAMERISEGIKDHFYALTLALTDAHDETLLIIVTDLSWGDNRYQAGPVRQAIWEKYGIPAERVILGGTHNHSGPAWCGVASETERNRTYFEIWYAGVAKSVEMALADRKPATLEIGRTKTENLAFVRRYFREDGTFLSGGPKEFQIQSDSPIVRHESEADEEVQLVRIHREGIKDIIIGQWQNHGCHTGNTRIAGTDWIGPMREQVESEIGCHYLYLQGCAGNLDTRSKITSEYPRKKTTDEIAAEVAAVMIEACKREETFTPICTGLIQGKQSHYEGIDFEDDPWTGELNTLSIGDLSLVTFPVEMFAKSGRDIKAKTPFAMTLLMGYTNGVTGYSPDYESYLHGGYETFSLGALGTAEDLVDIHLKELNKLYEMWKQTSEV